jgi:hypothetical protein
MLHIFLKKTMRWMSPVSVQIIKYVSKRTLSKRIKIEAEPFLKNEDKKFQAVHFNLIKLKTRINLVIPHVGFH